MGEIHSAALTEPFGSFSQIIADNAARLGDRIALRDDDVSITWAELGERVERIAARLVADGLERGQAVADPQAAFSGFCFSHTRCARM